MASTRPLQEWIFPADMPQHLRTMVQATGPVPSTATVWLVGERDALKRRGKAGGSGAQVVSFHLEHTGEKLDATFYKLTKKRKGDTDNRGVIVVNGPSFLFPVIIRKCGRQLYRPWRGQTSRGQDVLGYEHWVITKTVDNGAVASSSSYGQAATVLYCGGPDRVEDVQDQGVQEAVEEREEDNEEEADEHDEEDDDEEEDEHDEEDDDEEEDEEDDEEDDDDEEDEDDDEDDDEEDDEDDDDEDDDEE